MERGTSSAAQGHPCQPKNVSPEPCGARQSCLQPAILPVPAQRQKAPSRKVIPAILPASALSGGLVLAALLALTSSAIAQQNRIASPIDPARTVALKGHVHPKARPQYDRGPVDPALRISYATVYLKQSPGQQAALDQLLAGQQNPASPDHHRWLTPEQFAGRFGVSPGDTATIASWLRSQGLTVDRVARARNWIAFSGAARHINSAFRTDIHHYTQDGETHFANASDPSIPAALAGVVSAIGGLDDFRSESPAGKFAPIAPDFNSGSTHFLAPGDLATIYNIAPLYSAGIDGSGQKLVIIGRSRIDLSDVQAFRRQFNLPANDPQPVLVGADPGVSAGDASEANLDLQWSGAVARNATIFYVYGRSINTAIQYAVDQNLAPVMSLSYSICEPETVTTLALRPIAQQANAQGITWLSSSGDSGSAECDSAFSRAQATKGLAVSFLASMPEITAVGGAQFREGRGAYWGSVNGPDGGSALSYIPETAWNETTAGGLASTGGGASILFPKPAWQTGPGVPADNARDVPDVSLSSAGHDAYYIINNGQIFTARGTSASAPSFAGIVALLNQSVVASGAQADPGLGNINPQLYRLAQTTSDVFHDIVSGDNLVPCAQSSPDCVDGFMGYSAGPGYDQVTGLGSVDANNLIARWNSVSAATSTAVSANPGSVSWGGTVRLTATVTAANGATPTGSVTFTWHDAALGSAPLAGSGGTAAATLTVAAKQLAPGDETVSAIYDGNGVLSGSAASVVVTVTAPDGTAAVSLAVTNPVFAVNSPASGLTWPFTVRLTELAGVSATLTNFTIDGVAQPIGTFFSSTTIRANGTLAANIVGRSIPAPVTRNLVFSGIDAGGQPWSQQAAVPFLPPPVSATLALTSTPTAVAQNPGGDPGCQWTQQLNLEEQGGFGVQLTRFIAGTGNDISSQIQQLFGATRIAPFGSLQATLCWSGLTPPATKNFEIDGVDDNGTGVVATVTASFAAPASGAATLSVDPRGIVITASSSVAINLTGDARQATASVFPANRSTRWLKISPASNPASIGLIASDSGLSKGVYRATVIVQASNATPQFVAVPVVFVVGASANSNIAGASNAASADSGFAPGMTMIVSGSALANSTESASGSTPPLSMSGVSATVNGVSAPLFKVSPGELTIQIPYETGAGPAVLGVNNNGQVSSYLFQIAAAAPGIFVDRGTLANPSATAQRGRTVTLFITGEGEVTPALITGRPPAAGTAQSRLPKPRLPVSVTVGGVTAATQAIGVPAGLLGLTQINFTVPPDAPLDVQPVVVTVGTAASPPVNITVTQ